MDKGILGQLEKMKDATRAPKGYRAFERALTTHLSQRNQSLLFIQRPKATDVRGMKAWNEESRLVRQGEHGSYIVAPVVTEDDGTAVEFGDVRVFDITQTQPTVEA